MAALRWTRAALLAVVATTTGALAHVGADGLLPAPGVLAGLLVLMIVCSAAALTGGASAPRVVLLLVGGQSFVHFCLTALAGHREPTGMPGGAMEHEHAELGVEAAVAHVVGELTGPGAPMVIAHLAAAAVVAVWLAYGEAALFAVMALAAARMNPMLHISGQLVDVPLLKPVRVADPARRLHSVFASRALGRRGPPVGLLATT